ncbi:hypothetical protein V6N13_074767 [Hibiscus sabdariffa]
MLDRKQRRRPRNMATTDVTNINFPMQQSRYNPNFMDNDNMDVVVTQADLVTIPICEQPTILLPPSAIQNNIRVHAISPKVSLVKLKAKGKLPQAVRKPPSVNLGPKSVNIPMRKSCSYIASSSRSTKGQSHASILQKALISLLCMLLLVMAPLSWLSSSTMIF